jgi:DNA polymerase-3 subunit alpha
MGPNRPSLMAALPQAISLAERAAADAVAGQEDLFGGPADTPVTELKVPVLTDWGWGRKLDAERESLGLYLSGHPCDQYRSDLPFVCSATIESLLAAERPSSPGEFRGGGRDVTVAGIVAGIRKRGARVSVELDDGTGILEVGFFQESYDRFRHLLGAHALVAVSGSLRFDDFIQGWRLTAREVHDLDRLVEARATGLLLRWRVEEDRDLSAAVLRELLGRHRPGQCAVSVIYTRDGNQARVNLGREWSVRPTRDLRERLSELVGIDGFRFIYAGPRH